MMEQSVVITWYSKMVERAKLDLMCDVCRFVSRMFALIFRLKIFLIVQEDLIGKSVREMGFVYLS